MAKIKPDLILSPAPAANERKSPDDSISARERTEIKTFLRETGKHRQEKIDKVDSVRQQKDLKSVMLEVHDDMGQYEATSIG